jgi:hypothetical protein
MKISIFANSFLDKFSLSYSTHGKVVSIDTGRMNTFNQYNNSFGRQAKKRQKQFLKISICQVKTAHVTKNR